MNLVVFSKVWCGFTTHQIYVRDYIKFDHMFWVFYVCRGLWHSVSGTLALCVGHSGTVCLGFKTVVKIKCRAFWHSVPGTLALCVGHSGTVCRGLWHCVPCTLAQAVF